MLRGMRNAAGRLPGHKSRDAAYQWAGKFGKAGKDAVPGSLAQRKIGKTRLGYTAGGVAGVGAINRMRSPGSSGRDGLQPHSMGGTTMGPQSQMY